MESVFMSVITLCLILVPLNGPQPPSCTWSKCPSHSGAAGVPAVTDTAQADTVRALSQRVAHAVSTGGLCNPPSLLSQPTSFLSLQDCMEDRENTTNTKVGTTHPAAFPLDMGLAYPATSPLDMGLTYPSNHPLMTTSPVMNTAHRS